MTSYRLDRFAREITGKLADHARRLNGLETQPQLGNSSFEGSIDAYTVDGTLAAVLGRQWDGTYNAVTVTGPTPPTPVAPELTAVQGGIIGRWSGRFSGDALSPMDFSHVSLHCTTDLAAAGTVDTATLRATMSGELGDEHLIGYLPEELHYVWLVAWTRAGKPSYASAVSTATPLASATAEEIAAANQRITDAETALGQSITDLDTALAAKADIRHGTAAPTEPAPDGAVYWQHDGSLQGPVTAQWTRVAGAWQPSTLTDALFSNVSVGKLVAGSAELDQAVIDLLFTDVVKAKMVTSEAFIGENAILTGAITAPKITASEELTAKMVRGDMFDGKEFTGGTFRGGLFETLADVSPTNRRGIKVDGALNALMAFNSSGDNTFLLDGTTGDFSAIGEYSTTDTAPGGTTARAILGASDVVDYNDQSGSTIARVPTLRFEYDDPRSLQHPMVRSDYRTNVAMISGVSEERPLDRARLDLDFGNFSGFVQSSEGSDTVESRGMTQASMNLSATPDQATDFGPRWSYGRLTANYDDYVTGESVRGGFQVGIDGGQLEDHLETYVQTGFFPSAYNSSAFTTHFPDGNTEMVMSDALHIVAPGGIWRERTKLGGRLDYVGRELGATFGSINNATRPGLYVQSANANATTANGYPEASAGVLEVMANETGSILWQRYTVYKDRSNWTWTRSYYNLNGTGGWGAWNKLSQASIYAGKTTMNNVTANGGMVEVNITFPAGMFKTAPTVIGTPSNGRCTFITGTVTTTSAQIRCWNFTSGDAVNNVASWVAVSDGL